MVEVLEQNAAVASLGSDRAVEPAVATIPYLAADMVVAYLEAVGVKYVYGIPGGNIEPLYDAMLRSERRGGLRNIVARHEAGAAFMADGFARNAGTLGACCATTGPGTTNLITGVSSAYENNIPLLVITAQTSLKSFGRKASQESTDTGVNTVGMFQYCTGYNSLISHVEQLEHKLIAAMMTACNDSCPAHISVPLDVFRTPMPTRKLLFDAPALLKTPRLHDDRAVEVLSQQLRQARNIVFVLGASCNETVPPIIQVALALRAKIVTTPDGKGAVSPYHPLFYGVIGFGGHPCAEDALRDPAVDTVVAVGTTMGEWQSNGWDQDSLLNGRLIHIEPRSSNLTRSPMARLHVRGDVRPIFEALAAEFDECDQPLDMKAIAKEFEASRSRLQVSNRLALTNSLSGPAAEQGVGSAGLIKPQWLMAQLTQLFPPHTKYLADTGNSMAWAVHYLHPFDRRMQERRQPKRVNSPTANGNTGKAGRRGRSAGLFQVAVEFASMGWAIAAAIGASMACPRQPVVCITGDGSMLMSGQEITVAQQHNLSIVFVILNDACLGMVKHGQRLSGAEEGAVDLPLVDFSAMASALGVRGIRISKPDELLALDIDALLGDAGPTLIDVRIDPEEVPPIGVRVKTLKNG